MTAPSLTELSQALRDLHKSLLDAELENFPMARGTADRLLLAVEHPSFAWLHALSELIVEFDELSDADFRSRDLEYLQLAPAVALATGAVRRLLAGTQDPFIP